MLVETAIGDAYGAGFEFAPSDTFIFNTLGEYLPHPAHAMPPGSYTDDTQMSIAVAEVILDKGVGATRLDYADAFVLAFHRDPRLGYARKFRDLISRVTSGSDLLVQIRPHGTGAGSAMRACPIGFLPDIDDVLLAAMIQASVTHDSPAGIEAAQASALMAHYAVHGLGSRADLRAFLVERLGARWQEPHEGSVPNLGLVATNAALTAIERNQTAGDILIASVDFTGDVDTVAAIAMAVAAHLLAPCDRGLPEHLRERLEPRGRFGRPYLDALDRRLAAFQDRIAG